MRMRNVTSKIYALFFAFGILTSSTFAQHGGQDTENVSKYKTPQMVSFIEGTINYLKSIDKPNKRHLLKLSRCRSIFSSGQKLVRGGEIIALKTCTSLLNKGAYDEAIIKTKIKEESLINQKQRVNNITNKKSTDKEKIKVETKDFVEKEKSLGKDNDLLFF